MTHYSLRFREVVKKCINLELVVFDILFCYYQDPQTTCRIIGFCSKGDIFTAIRIRMKLIKLLKQFNQVLTNSS